jgi:hypothetical protein
LSELRVQAEPAFSKWIKFALKFVAIISVATWVLDAGWFYVRRSFPAAGKASGSVHRVRLLAISDKGNKTEFELDAVTPEEDVPCANSIFPHGGQNPCWYVVKHAKDPIPM